MRARHWDHCLVEAMPFGQQVPSSLHLASSQGPRSSAQQGLFAVALYRWVRKAVLAVERRLALAGLLAQVAGHLDLVVPKQLARAGAAAQKEAQKAEALWTAGCWQTAPNQGVATLQKRLAADQPRTAEHPFFSAWSLLRRISDSGHKANCRRTDCPAKSAVGRPARRLPSLADRHLADHRHLADRRHRHLADRLAAHRHRPNQEVEALYCHRHLADRRRPKSWSDLRRHRRRHQVRRHRVDSSQADPNQGAMALLPKGLQAVVRSVHLRSRLGVALGWPLGSGLRHLCLPSRLLLDSNLALLDSNLAERCQVGRLPPLEVHLHLGPNLRRRPCGGRGPAGNATSR